jgi:hypothetical protein
MQRAFLGLAAILMAGVVAAPHLAFAEGAVAIGRTKDAVGYGAVVKANSAAVASRAALDQCQQSRPDIKTCRVTATFRHQCVAFAFPAGDERGFGWSLGKTEAAAEQRAVAQCTASSKKKGAAGCKVSDTACDP